MIYFLLGLIIGTAAMWLIHIRHKKAWQAEYRRLMGGIEGARQMALISVDSPQGILKDISEKLYDIQFGE